MMVRGAGLPHSLSFERLQGARFGDSTRSDRRKRGASSVVELRPVDPGQLPTRGEVIGGLRLRHVGAPGEGMGFYPKSSTGATQDGLWTPKNPYGERTISRRVGERDPL